MLVTPRSLFCIESDLGVRNYPIQAPLEEEWQEVLEAVRERLLELKESRVAPRSSDKAASVVDLVADEDTGVVVDEDVGELVPYRDLLYPQLEITSKSRVEKQLVLLKYMTRKLRDSFNQRFNAANSRKGRIIDEVQRLNRRRTQLKEELKLIREENKDNMPEKEKEDLQDDDDFDEDLPTMEEEGEADDEEEEEEYCPQWNTEERPELLLELEPPVVEAEEDEVGSQEDEGSIGVKAGWAAAKALRAFSNKKTSQGSTDGSNRPSSGHHCPVVKTDKPRSEWTWAEARAYRAWRAQQEEQQRRQRSHARTLALQLERITPTIKSLLQEFDAQVSALVESRVETDQALLLYQLVSSQLQQRLFMQEKLAQEQVHFQNLLEQVSVRLREVEEDLEETRGTEGRARGKEERLQEQLREEEVTLRRTIINLPIDQYNQLMAIYTKRGGGGGGGRGDRGHDGSRRGSARESVTPAGGLPLVPGAVSPGPLTPGRPQSPTPSEASHVSGQHGMKQRQPSTTSISEATKDDPAEDCVMPEGMAGGARTWRQFLKFRKRRQELMEEIDDVSSRRATAQAQLGAAEIRKNTLLQETKEVEKEVERVTHALAQLDEDVEVVAILSQGQLQFSLHEMTATLQPEFSHTRLLNKTELDELERTANRGCGDGSGGEEEEDEETEALRTLKGQLELEVELAKQELHEISTFKVGRDVMAAASGAFDKQQLDSTQLYASLQRLQQLHGGQTRGIEVEAEKVDKQIETARKRVAKLQARVDKATENIENLQFQVAEAQPDVVAAKREARLKRVMVCSELNTQVRSNDATILQLEKELDTLRLRTFPMLSRPS